MKYSNFDLKVEEFMLYGTSRNLSPKTLKAYEQTLKLFSHYLVKFHKIDDAEDVIKTIFDIIFHNIKVVLCSQGYMKVF